VPAQCRWLFNERGADQGQARGRRTKWSKITSFSDRAAVAAPSMHQPFERRA
jgi:hypothetical protein